MHDERPSDLLRRALAIADMLLEEGIMADELFVRRESGALVQLCAAATNVCPLQGQKSVQGTEAAVLRRLGTSGDEDGPSDRQLALCIVSDVLQELGLDKNQRDNLLAAIRKSHRRNDETRHVVRFAVETYSAHRPRRRTVITSVVPRYKDWCRRHGIKPLPDTAFKRHFASLLGHLGRYHATDKVSPTKRGPRRPVAFLGLSEVK